MPGRGPGPRPAGRRSPLPVRHNRRQLSAWAETAVSTAGSSVGSRRAKAQQTP